MFMRKLSFVFIFAGIVASVAVMGQKNRYGMSLSGEKGNYTLSDRAEICALVDCNKLPADVYLEYKHQDLNVSPNDYAYCKTTTYVYKTYGTYSLSMIVDVPQLTEGPHPFIIYVHGGGWSGGNASAFENQSRYMASRGIAGVRITYSLTGQGGNFDIAMQDVADAFAFVQAHASEWNLDMSRFGYAGGSAGTPLASLQAMKQSGTKLFMGCNGMYDFQNNLDGNWGKTSAYFVNYPNVSNRGAISSINYIPDTDIPAVALFHGSADFTISCKQSSAFASAVSAKGGRAECHIYDYYVHGFFNRGSTDKFEEVMSEMYAFAKDVFGVADVTLPEDETIEGDLLIRFSFTDGSNEPEILKPGLDVSPIQTGNTKATYTEYDLQVTNWSTQMNIAGLKRYVGFQITAKPESVVVVEKVGVSMKRSDNTAKSIMFNHGTTLPSSEPKGVQLTAGTDQYETYFLQPNASSPAKSTGTDNPLCIAIGTLAENTSVIVYFDEITVYGTVTSTNSSLAEITGDENWFFLDGKCVKISMPAPGSLVEIFDVAGRKQQVSIVDDEGNIRFMLNDSGYYIIRVTNETGSRVKKIRI